MRRRMMLDGGSSLVLQERMDVDAGSRVLASVPMTVLRASITTMTHPPRRPTTGSAMWQSLCTSLATAKSNDGYLPVRYFLLPAQQGFGRFKAAVDLKTVDKVGDSMPFVYIKRKVRGWVAATHNLDVDMANCHPSLMLQVYGRIEASRALGFKAMSRIARRA